MFVVMSRFKVANGMAAEVRQAFRDRPRLVEEAPGFLRMDVLGPVDQPEEICLLTYWADETAFRRWHHSDAHHVSHRGIPGGLRLDPKGTQLRFFEHICS